MFVSRLSSQQYSNKNKNKTKNKTKNKNKNNNKEYKNEPIINSKYAKLVLWKHNPHHKMMN